MSGPVTPRLSHHARERCREMHVSTKSAKRIVQRADIRRPAERGGTFATWDGEPLLAVVYVEDTEDGRPYITSVVWRTEHKYEREEGGYRVVPSANPK